MPGGLLLRFLGAVLIILLGLAVYRLFSHQVLRRAQGAARARGLVQPGKPAILLFTTPDCVPCKTVQRPALQALQNRMGDRLQVVEVDAYERPDLAHQWGVLSVPTTFVLDASGSPRAVNNGAASAQKLYEQLERITQGAA